MKAYIKVSYLHWSILQNARDDALTFSFENTVETYDDDDLSNRLNTFNVFSLGAQQISAPKI